MLMPHILPKLTNETIGWETWDYCPVYFNALAQSTQSAKILQQLYGTQAGRDDLLFTMINPLFSFLLSMVVSRRIFFG